MESQGTFKNSQLNVVFNFTGKDNVNIDELKKFVSEQTQLRFLGLMLTEACKDEMFLAPGSTLIVSGSANEAQVIESLQRYLGRQHYVKKSLSHLFVLTQGYSVPRVDIIKVTSRTSRLNTLSSGVICQQHLSRMKTGA